MGNGAIVIKDVVTSTVMTEIIAKRYNGQVSSLSLDLQYNIISADEHTEQLVYVRYVGGYVGIDGERLRNKRHRMMTLQIQEIENVILHGDHGGPVNAGVMVVLRAIRGYAERDMVWGFSIRAHRTREVMLRLVREHYHSTMTLLYNHIQSWICNNDKIEYDEDHLSVHCGGYSILHYDGLVPCITCRGVAVHYVYPYFFCDNHIGPLRVCIMERLGLTIRGIPYDPYDLSNHVVGGRGYITRIVETIDCEYGEIIGQANLGHYLRCMWDTFQTVIAQKPSLRRNKLYQALTHAVNSHINLRATDILNEESMALLVAFEDDAHKRFTLGMCSCIGIESDTPSIESINTDDEEEEPSIITVYYCIKCYHEDVYRRHYTRQRVPILRRPYWSQVLDIRQHNFEIRQREFRLHEMEHIAEAGMMVGSSAPDLVALQTNFEQQLVIVPATDVTPAVVGAPTAELFELTLPPIEYDMEQLANRVFDGPLFMWAIEPAQQMDVCAVCQETFEPPHMTWFCGRARAHGFHPSCALDWIERNQSCPVCRCNLTYIDVNYCDGEIHSD